MTIIFTGGEHPSCTHTKNFIHSFNTHSNFVIAADSGLLFCAECGFTPDIICGDFDSLLKMDTTQDSDNDLKKQVCILQKKYPSAKIKQWPKEKDYTDTQIALQEAVKNTTTKKNTDCIILVGGDGGRSDHFLANLKLFEYQTTPDYWLCKEQFIKLLVESSEYTVKQSSEFSIFPIFNSKFSQPNEYFIQSTNLVWPLDTVKWDQSMYSLSNRINKNSTSAKLKIIKGRFLFFSLYTD
jgi:thiamine pyrophosphokinase